MTKTYDPCHREDPPPELIDAAREKQKQQTEATDSDRAKRRSSSNCSATKSARTCSLIEMEERWRSIASAWQRTAEDLSDTDSGAADRAAARSAVYLNCAEDLNAAISKPNA